MRADFNIGAGSVRLNFVTDHEDPALITLQSVMLIALGAFAAGFFAFFLAPLYRRRAARLAIEELKQSMPLTEAEIRADKDRLRAENAIAIHRLETRLEESSLVAARQRVEINRRDAAISSLESELTRIGTILDEHENARRVMEQTIAERLPMVERRLRDAKELLSQRDQEIAVLTEAADKNARALDEATQINTRQREDLHRLNATLATRQANSRSSFSDAGVETEIALRGEIEALRAKARDQAELIETLKSGSGTRSVSGSPGASTAQSDEMESLKVELAQARLALREAKGDTEKDAESRSVLEKQVAAGKAEADRLRSELSRLKAALNVYETTDTQQRATKETKVALKARVGALETEVLEQSDTIRRLKAEIAANNDKMARQAAHYVDVIKRLGGGTQPVTGQASVTRKPANTTATRGTPGARRTDPLMDRLTAPRKDGRALMRSASTSGASSAKPAERESGKVSDFIRALSGDAGRSAHNASAKSGDPNSGATAPVSKPAAPNTPNVATEGDGAGARAARPGLLERLASGDKPVA